MRFRPCIDLHDGKVKQIVGGTLSADGAGLRTNFESEHDSAYFARMYRADRLAGGHVIMLGPGNEEAALSALRAYPGGLQVGGGIHPGNARRFLDAGASQVIVTSYMIADGEVSETRLKELQRIVPRDQLVLDLSCRKRGDGYRIVFDRWQQFTTARIDRPTLERLSEYCCEFLVHAVDVEGKMAGIDPELIALLAEYAPVPCVYAGGVATYEDIDRIREAGRNRIDFTVGSALDIFGGPLSYRRIAAARTE